MARANSEYDDLIRFRAPSSLRLRIEKILEKRGHGDISEFLREAATKYLDEEEGRVNAAQSAVALAQRPEVVAEVVKNLLEEAAKRASGPPHTEKGVPPQSGPASVPVPSRKKPRSRE